MDEKRYIHRDRYLQKLINRKENGLIKVITGLRRCGKSYLLFEIYMEYLLSLGVQRDQIIAIPLDDDQNAVYRNPAALSQYVRALIVDPSRMYYVFLDEVQFAITREEMRGKTESIALYDVLNGLLHLKNVDIYVTGSNSKMLSTDVLTAFRGRGDVVEVNPLSFREYYDYVGGDKSDAFEEYALYGGMPLVVRKRTDEEKYKYLESLFQEVYFKDISERYAIEYPDVLAELTDDLCSSVGSLTNAAKIAKTLASVKNVRVSSTTISQYLKYLTESFLFRCARRYDIKGKRYFEYPSKYYCADIGLRNVKLNLRQQEETHIMENIIYNELVIRGYSVDVGVVETEERDEAGERRHASREIDFVVNRGSKRYYIQTALTISDPTKAEAEMKPFMLTKDFFKKIIITKTSAKAWTDDNGILHLGLYEFLLDEESLFQ